MKSKEFEKFIDSSYNKEMQAIYDNLKKKLNVPDNSVSAPAEIWNTESPSAVTAAAKQAAKPAQKPASKRRQFFKNFFKKPARLAACVSAAVAIVCVAIMLPFTLNNSGVQPTTPPTISDERFVEAAACKEIKLDCSLEEYSARNDLSLFYIDRYDIADIITSLYVDEKDPTDIVYFEEVLIHKGTGSITELYITDLRTKVDKIQAYKKGCYRSYKAYIVKSYYVTVFWGTDTFISGGRTNTYYKAHFTYANYQYVIALRYPVDENEIFDLIDSMVPPVKR